MKNWFLHDGQVYRENQLFNEDLLIIEGKVAAFGTQARSIRANTNYPIRDFSAEGCIISRGFIDLHVHLREPGYETKETIKTGTKAAAAGGFTSVFVMPNTLPPLDSVEALADLQKRVQQSAVVKVFPIAALTMKRRGTHQVDYSALTKAGVKFFSDDGEPLNSDLLYDVMEEISALDAVVINHLEDKDLAGTGRFHQDIPAESEYLMLGRDLKAVSRTNCSYHAAHLSCEQSVALIAEAKAKGLPVTAEVTPHHLTLTYDNIKEPKGHFQMKPPLRSTSDQAACIEGIKSGIIDIIATDHAPHGDEKRHNDLSAPFGVTGLETAFPALYTKLVLTERLSIKDILRSFTVNPAKIAGEHPSLAVGVTADITVIKLDCNRLVNYEMFYSKGTNSPYIGETLLGWPILTLVDGEERYGCQL